MLRQEKKLEEVLGDNLNVKLDLFHAIQRITKTVPKHGKQDSVIKMIRRRMTNDFTMIFRDPSDHGPSRTMNTPSISIMLQQLDNFILKWKPEKYNEENILPHFTLSELSKLRKHMEKGCLSDIPPSWGSNRNEALHKTLRKNISRQRLGIQLALVLLGIGFFAWNEKRSQVRKDKKEDRLSSIQSYYSSFLKSSKTPSEESFGISASKRPDMMQKILSESDIDPNREITDRFQKFFAENQSVAIDPRYIDGDSDSDSEAVCDPLLLTARSVVKTMLVKARVSISLAARINAKPKHVAKNINFAESSLLLLGNSMFKPNENSCSRVDAILKGYGLERVHMPKDGNCLFSSISFFILHFLSAELQVPDTKLREHLQTLNFSKPRIDRNFSPAEKTCK